ncbi:hypothetical protein BDZ85DRAFT_116788 [Elsinoe ampelina]|uniref:Uncharacterized protein n=1 Tax=Elsinoe ampelina TaxID=302913 RepID=A0A6A6FXL8_9PEZI|nr:hypothetical protein BDZ85DRAFT_116788 [Elsinoe ampelina]
MFLSLRPASTIKEETARNNGRHGIFDRHCERHWYNVLQRGHFHDPVRLHFLLHHLSIHDVHHLPRCHSRRVNWQAESEFRQSVYPLRSLDHDRGFLLWRRLLTTSGARQMDSRMVPLVAARRRCVIHRFFHQAPDGRGRSKHLRQICKTLRYTCEPCLLTSSNRHPSFPY